MQFPQLHVGIGQPFGSFTIFPVWSDTPGKLGLSTGAHAQLLVSELASGPEVNRLTVRNAGSKAALLVEGELLEGGHQHRVAGESLVLGPGEQADVPAFCVEQGRWGGPSTQHGRRARRAPLHVRAELAGLAESTGDGLRPLRPADQGRVWQRVERFSGGVSATGSLVEAFDSFDSASLRSTTKSAAPLEGQRGVVVGLAGRALMLELFGTSTLFARHWDQFAHSLLFEAEHDALLGAQPTPGQAARDFVAGLSATYVRPLLTGAEHRHGSTLRSLPVRALVDRYAYSGICVDRTGGLGQFAHLSVWDATHPLAAA